jgi:hypothetical protein
MQFKTKMVGAATAALMVAGLLAVGAAPAQAATNSASIGIWSPTIVETNPGGATGPEDVSDAAARAEISITFNTAPRNWVLKVRPHAGGAWTNWETHNVAGSASSNPTTARGLAGNNIFRPELFRSWDYQVVIDEPAPAPNVYSNIVNYDTQRPAPVFSSDFGGAAGGDPTDKWEMLDGGGVTGYATNSWDAGALTGTGVYKQSIKPDNAPGRPDDCYPGYPRCHVLDQHLVAKDFNVPVPPVGGVTWIAARVKFDMNYRGSTAAFWTYDRTPTDTNNDGHYNENDIFEYTGQAGDSGRVSRTTWFDPDKTDADGDPQHLDQTKTAPPSGKTWDDNYHIWAIAYRQPTAGNFVAEHYLDGYYMGVKFPTGSAAMPSGTTKTCASIADNICTSWVPRDLDQTLMISNHVPVWQQDSNMTWNIVGEEPAGVINTIPHTHDVLWDWVQVWTS